MPKLHGDDMRSPISCSITGQSSGYLSWYSAMAEACAHKVRRFVTSRIPLWSPNVILDCTTLRERLSVCHRYLVEPEHCLHRDGKTYETREKTSIIDNWLGDQ